MIVSSDDSRANMPISLVTRAVWRVAKTISAVITVRMAKLTALMVAPAISWVHILILS